MADLRSDAFARARKQLWNELVQLHDTWAQYIQLYGSSRERIGLLNETARWFFALLQRVMLRDVFLGIARLTDEPGSGQRKNLTIRVLLDDPEVVARPELCSELERLMNAAATRAAPIRKHRNKYIAHLDHAVAVGAHDDPLPSVLREEISGVVDDFATIYNVHSGAIHDSNAFFDLDSDGSAEALAQALVDARSWRALQDREWRRRHGIEDPSDGAV